MPDGIGYFVCRDPRRYADAKGTGEIRLYPSILYRQNGEEPERNGDAMKLQFVNWYPEWRGFSFMRSKGCIILIYDWFLDLGWFEIRKWREPPATQKDIDEYNKRRVNP